MLLKNGVPLIHASVASPWLPSLIRDRFFMAAVDRRKIAVFGTVFLAALIATGASALSVTIFRSYLNEISNEP